MAKIPTVQWFAGQKVVTSAGTVRTVALVRGQTVWAFGPRGLEVVRPLYDALGGEAGESAMAA